jgi:hypothetical protein
VKRVIKKTPVKKVTVTVDEAENSKIYAALYDGEVRRLTFTNAERVFIWSKMNDSRAGTSGQGQLKEGLQYGLDFYDGQVFEFDTEEEFIDWYKAQLKK